MLLRLMTLTIIAISTSSFDALSQDNSNDDKKCLESLRNSEEADTNDLLDCLLEMANTIDKLKDRKNNAPAVDDAIFPEGAIVAFTEACPADKGWMPYTQATGRFVVGAGQDTLRAYRQWNRQLPAGGTQQVDLPLYEVEAIGGEVHHTTSLNEMPAHNHGGATGNNTKDVHTGRAGAACQLRCTAGYGVDPSGNFHTHSIGSQGKSAGHNNMPPYIALFFCEYKGSS